jgi:hypothetical protein
MITQTKPVKENPFVSIVFNIFLPVVILQQVSKRLGDQGPLIALIVALALPLGYGIWDLIKNKHKNYVSLFGMISVLFTGGFALFRLEGFWFAVKEAAFPAVMALGVAASALSRRPFMAVLFCHDQLLRMPLIEQRLQERSHQEAFKTLIQRATVWLAGSFVLSSVLNYVLARRIFTELDPNLSELSRAEQLNTQIAQMTGWGFLAIALPMMVFTGLVLFFFLRRLSHLTGLSIDELTRQ